MRQDFNRSIKFFLALLTFGTIFWLGGITARAIIANEFFISGTLQYRPEISLDIERTLFQLVSATSSIALTAYVMVLVSAIYLIIKLSLRMKEHGWLLIASILFFLFVPVELFTAYLDLNFIFVWQKTKNILETQGMHVYSDHSTHLRETLSHRIGALSGLPIIALLCYYTAVTMIVWQPLKRIKSHETDETQSES